MAWGDLVHLCDRWDVCFHLPSLEAPPTEICAIVLLLFATAWNVNDYFNEKNAFDLARATQRKKEQGKALTKEEESAITAWESIVAEKKPSTEKLDEEIEAYHQGYFSILMHKVPINQYMETTFLYRIAFFETLAMMLLGMAFLKNGILKGEKSNRHYFLLAAVGYSVGLSVNYWETSYWSHISSALLPGPYRYYLSTRTGIHHVGSRRR